MTDTKKPSKTSNWVGVGDSAEGIRNLRPDALRQAREQIKAIDTKIKQNGIPSSSTPLASNTKTPPKGK